MSDTGAEAVKPDPGSSSRMIIPGAGVGHENAESCMIVCPLRIPLVIADCAAHMLLLADELMRCCVAGTNECHDLRHCAFALDGQVQAEWSICPCSVARRPRDSVAPLR